MTRPLGCAALGLLLLGCDPADQPPPAAAPTYVTQTNNYTTNVYPPGTALPDAGAIPTTPSATPSAAPDAAAPISSNVPQQAPPPRNLASTGVPECDAYLARVETCSAAMLRGNESALNRIRESLDLARRNWRRAAAGHEMSRDILVDQCSTSLRMYDQQASPYCH